VDAQPGGQRWLREETSAGPTQPFQQRSQLAAACLRAQRLVEGNEVVGPGRTYLDQSRGGSGQRGRQLEQGLPGGLEDLLVTRHVGITDHQYTSGRERLAASAPVQRWGMTDGAGATDGYSALRNDVTLGSRIFGPLRFTAIKRGEAIREDPTATFV
jgi:hypothetical protein